MTRALLLLSMSGVFAVGCSRALDVPGEPTTSAGSDASSDVNTVMNVGSNTTNFSVQTALAKFSETNGSSTLEIALFDFPANCGNLTSSVGLLPYRFHMLELYIEIPSDEYPVSGDLGSGYAAASATYTALTNDDSIQAFGSEGTVNVTGMTSAAWQGNFNMTLVSTITSMSAGDIFGTFNATICP